VVSSVFKELSSINDDQTSAVKSIIQTHMQQIELELKVKTFVAWMCFGATP